MSCRNNLYNYLKKMFLFELYIVDFDNITRIDRKFLCYKLHILYYNIN